MTEYEKSKLKLRLLFSPKQCNDFALFELMRMKPEPSESIPNYDMRLRNSADKCDFTNWSAEKMIKNLIISNKHDEIKTGIPCNQCRCIIHKKCCNLGQYYMLSKKNTLKTWNCFICQKDNFPFMDMDDIDFLEGSFNSNFDSVCQNQNKIEKDDNYDILEKLELCELNSSHHQLNNELDIDENLTLKNNFKYYKTHDFHKLLKRKEISNVGNCFSVLHTNISSLQCNFSKLELLLHNLDHNFKVIAVTETWNSVHKKHLFASKILLGYHQYEGMTGETLKSGCGFFIANDLSYFVRRDISKSFYSVSSEFQALWIEIINKKGPNFVIGSVYRHPRKNSKELFDYLSETITSSIYYNQLILLTIINLP